MIKPSPVDDFITIALLAVVMTFLIADCGGLSSTDQTALKQAAQLNAMSYSYLDASSAAAALERGAYCADWGIARRNSVSIVDAGIACESP